MDWLRYILYPMKFGIPVDQIHLFQLFASNAIDMTWFNKNRIVHGQTYMDPQGACRVGQESMVH